MTASKLTMNLQMLPYFWIVVDSVEELHVQQNSKKYNMPDHGWPIQLTLMLIAIS